MPRTRRLGKNPASPESVLKVLKEGNSKQQKEVLAHYLTAARMIPLRVDIWEDLQRVFYAGLAGTNDEDYTQNERDIYKRLLDMIPFLGPVMDALGNDAEATVLENFVTLISRSALSSRNGDTHTLKTNILLYAPTITDLEDFAIAKPTAAKTSRGWRNAHCSALLTPPRLLDDFLSNPKRFSAKVRSHELKITANEWPSYLYKDPAKAALPKKEHRGLLRGPLLVNAFRCIFTGPASAMEKKAKGNSKSQAEIHGITQVEPWGIIYVAVQVRQALSSSSQWTNKDLRFDYIKFTNRLLELFKGNDNRWVQELLAWWNEQVCFSRSRSRNDNSDSDGDAEDEHVVPIANLLQQAEEDSESDDNNENTDTLSLRPLQRNSPTPKNSRHQDLQDELANPSISGDNDAQNDPSEDDEPPPISSRPRSISRGSPQQSLPGSRVSSPLSNRKGKRPAPGDESELTQPSDDDESQPPSPKPPSPKLVIAKSTSKRPRTRANTGSS